MLYSSHTASGFIKGLFNNMIHFSFHKNFEAWHPDYVKFIPVNAFQPLYGAVSGIQGWISGYGSRRFVQVCVFAKSSQKNKPIVIKNFSNRSGV